MLKCRRHSRSVLRTRLNNKRDLVGHGGMHANQNHAGSLQRLATLQSDLPEILVQRQDQPALGFREFQKGGIFKARIVSSRPKHIVTISAHGLDGRKRDVLVGQDEHLCWDGVCLILVRQVAGIREASQNVFVRDPRIVVEHLSL